MNCVRCGEELSGYAAVSEGSSPSAGDISLCFYCGNLALFTGNDLEMREATPEERARLVQDPEVHDAYMMMFDFSSRSAGKPAVKALCGCVFGVSEKAFYFLPCSPTCDLYAFFVEEARKQGKLIDIIGQ